MIPAVTPEPENGSLSVNMLKEFLQGEWWLLRDIDDRRLGKAGRFEGEALFAPLAEGLLYDEAGRMRFGDHEGPAARRYRYDFPAPQRAAVSFAEGGFFHDLDLTTGTWSTEHRCGADHYRGEFRVEGPACWSADWRVTGPRKNLRLRTRFRRRA